MDALSPETWEKYEELNALYGDIGDQREFRVFACGFSMGMALTLEALPKEA